MKSFFLVLLFVRLIRSDNPLCNTSNVIGCVSFPVNAPVPHANRACCNGAGPDIYGGVCACSGSVPCTPCDIIPNMTTRIPDYLSLLPPNSIMCYIMSDNFCQGSITENVTFMNSATTCQLHSSLTIGFDTSYLVSCSNGYVTLQHCPAGCQVCSDVYAEPPGYCNTAGRFWGPSVVCYCSGYGGLISCGETPSQVAVTLLCGAALLYIVADVTLIVISFFEK